MNGATEATLAELLAVAQAQNVNLINMLKELKKQSSSGGGGGAGVIGATTAAISNLGSSLNPVTLAINAVSGAANILSNVISGLAGLVGNLIGVVTDLAGNLVNFSKKAASGAAKLSDFYDAFKDLPLMLGTVSSVFATIIRYAEDLLTSYRAMTKNGASFSGSLMEMAGTATRARLFIDEFVKVVKANSDIFATLTGNVDSGIKRFAEYSNIMLDPKGPYAKRMMALGYTAEESAGQLGLFIQMQGTMNKKGLENSRQVAEGATKFAEEIDLYVKLSGKERAEVEKSLKEKAFDKQWQYMLRNMRPEQVAEANLALLQAFEAGGKGMEDNVKMSIMTGGRVQQAYTDAGKTFAVMQGETGQRAVDAYSKTVLDGTLSEKQRLDLRRESDRQLAVNTQELVERFGDTATILGANGSKYFSAETMGYANALRNQKTQKQITEENEAALRRQRQQGVGDAKALAQAEQNIRDFGLIIRNLTNTIIGPFLGPLVKFGETITGLVAKFVGSKGFTKAVGDVADWFTNLFDSLSKAQTGTDIIQIIGRAVVDAFGNIWAVLKPIWEDTIKPGMKQLWEDTVPIVVKLFNRMIEIVTPYFKELGLAIQEVVEDYLKASSKGLFGTSDSANSRRGQDAYMAKPEFQEWLKKRQATALDTANPEMIQRYNTTRLNRDALIQEFMKELADRAANKLPDAKPVIKTDTRSLGTIGKTGQTSEPTDTVVSIEKGERVLTPGETSSYNNLESALQRLNNTTALLLLAMKETAENTKQNVRATNKLSGDLFA